MQDAGQEIHAGKISRLPLPFWVFFLLNGWIDAYRLTRAVIGAVRHRVISKAGGPGKNVTHQFSLCLILYSNIVF